MTRLSPRFSFPWQRLGRGAVHIKLIVATVLAVATLASWSAYASSNVPPYTDGQSFIVDAGGIQVSVWENLANGGSPRDRLVGGVPLTVIAQQVADCVSAQSGQAYIPRQPTDRVVYAGQTTPAGEHLGKARVGRCDSGSYELTISVPKGFRIEGQPRQTVAVTRNELRHAAFVLIKE